jgi:hypothetical protein
MSQCSHSGTTEDDLMRFHEYSRAVLNGVRFALTLFVSPTAAMDDATSNYAAEREV